MSATQSPRKQRSLRLAGSAGPAYLAFARRPAQGGESPQLGRYLLDPLAAVILPQNQICPARLRRHEFRVHRFHGLPELLFNGSAATATTTLVARQTAAQPELRRTIQENAESQQTADRRPAQQPKAIH